MSAEKLCMFCPHFMWEGVDYVYYSTLTGGELTGGAFCQRQHFDHEKPANEHELRRLLLRAETCPDYTLPVGVSK